ncbi:MAG TPA: hypothetical protein VKA68_17455 [bacterium]|nr:hypothetical protein [bacterium]
MRTLSALRYDILFQLRHGFYTAYALLTVIYIGILLNLPVPIRGWATVLLIFSDTSVLGYFFIGGIILMERRQGTLDTLTVTPLRPWEYLWAKILSLTGISMIVSALILLITAGIRPDLGWFLTGVFLSAIFFTLIGLAIAVRSSTVNEYFFRGIYYYIIFMIPLVDFFGLAEHPVFYLFPTLAILTLLESVFRSHSLSQLWFAVAILLIWCVLGWIWVRAWFRKYVILRKGGNR